MNKTKIEWCDYTWNPFVGCSKVSAGCEHCYASALAKRFHQPWGKAEFKPERLNQPAKTRTPSKIFVCSMSDIGHESIKPTDRLRVFGVMRESYWHTYIILTKRPGEWLREVPGNAWCGVTVENMEYRFRLMLLQHFRGLKFVSVEPMLEPVTFEDCEIRPDWVIAGPETGTCARPCSGDWIDALADESPCFFDKRKDGWGRREWPEVEQGEYVNGLDGGE